ncbi:hypothetical protein JCM11251_003458 [Rhodosporidiobolus azoricus]
MRNGPQLAIFVAPTTESTSPTSLLSSTSSSSALPSASSSSMPSLSPLVFTPDEPDLNVPLMPSTSYFPASPPFLTAISTGSDAPRARLRERIGDKRYREISDEEAEEKGEEAEPQDEFRKAGRAVEKAMVKSGAHQGTFIYKLYQLILEPTTDHLVTFSPDGHAFTVYDPATFSQEVLSRYYRHSNFASFTRQLNMYGFRKVARNSRDIPVTEQSWSFSHPKFRRGDLNSIGSIRRNPVTPSVITTFTTRATGQQCPIKRRLSVTCRKISNPNKNQLAALSPADSSSSASVEGGEFAPISPQTSVPETSDYSFFGPPVVQAPSLPPPVATPSAPRLRQLSGPFTFAPLPSGLTAPALSPNSVETFEGLSPTPAETDTLRRERDDLAALTRQMHRDLHIFSRQLKEMTSRCEMSVNVAANLKALVVHRGGEQDLGEFPDFLFDPRFMNPAAPLSEIRTDPRPRFPLALQPHQPPSAPAYDPHTPHLIPPDFRPGFGSAPCTPQPVSSAPVAPASQNPIPHLPNFTETHHSRYLHVDTQHLTPCSSSYAGSLQGSAEEPGPHAHLLTSAIAVAGVGLGITFNSTAPYVGGTEASQSPEHAAFGHGEGLPMSYPHYPAVEPDPLPPLAHSPAYEGYAALATDSLSSHLSTSSLHSFNGGVASASASSSPDQTWTPYSRASSGTYHCAGGEAIVEGVRQVEMR